MKKPEDLRMITENTLSGLVADESLKFRILQKAAGQDEFPAKRFLRTVSLLRSALAVLLVAVFALNSVDPIQSAGPGDMIAFTAGKTASNHDSLFSDGFDTDSVIRIQWDGAEPVSDPQECSSLVSVLKEHSSEVSDQTGLFSEYRRLVISAADGSSCSFDTAAGSYLITDDGRWWSCDLFFTELNKLIR